MDQPERTTGIVLRTRLLTESSLIAHWLTADAGRVATVARGARRPKSTFRGKIDLFHEADFTFRRSRRSELHTLCELNLGATFGGLRTDWRRLTQACYGVALIEQTTETDTPLPGTWALFRAFLGEAEVAPWSPSTVLALELRHLADLGQLPDFERESLPARARELAEHLLHAGWGVPVGAGLDPGLIPLSRFLRGFLAFHLGRLPRGRGEALGERGF